MEDQENVDVDSSQTDRLREIFAIFDRDDSGFIDPDELKVALRALGCNPTDAEIEQMNQDAEEKVDAEHGKIDFDAFCEIIAKYHRNADDVEAELLKAFQFFDKNEDGSIDKTELREALKAYGNDKLTDDDIDELFAEADTNDDGRINYHELVTVICKN